MDTANQQISTLIHVHCCSEQCAMNANHVAAGKVACETFRLCAPISTTTAAVADVSIRWTLSSVPNSAWNIRHYFLFCFGCCISTLYLAFCARVVSVEFEQRSDSGKRQPKKKKNEVKYNIYKLRHLINTGREKKSFLTRNENLRQPPDNIITRGATQFSNPIKGNHRNIIIFPSFSLSSRHFTGESIQCHCARTHHIFRRHPASHSNQVFLTSENIFHISTCFALHRMP